MTVRVAPDEPFPTHHVALRDRSGRRVGLILCDANGNISPRYSKNPIERTSLKTTSGSSTYSDFNYPYSPIVQDDWSGGRGNLDYERDTTRFYDSFRVRTGKSNKVFLGPQEQYTTGNRAQNNAAPGNVTFYALTGNRYLAKRFVASESYTAGLVWLLARRKGEPADLTVAIYSDSAGQLNAQLSSITIASTRLTDILSEWLDETISQALTSGTAYWLVVYGASTDDTDNHWEVAVKQAVGTTYLSASGGAWANWTAATVDLYFRLTTANSEQTAIFYEYKEQQYVVIGGLSGAPKLYVNGDRGTADANTGQLGKVIDATKAWTVDEFVGCVVMLTDGTGKTEAQPYRTITANTATELTCDTAWTITHDTTTEYVILGAAKWREITGHGLTAPVTDVLVSTTGVVYFAMGDAVNIRRMREYTSAGVWTREYADDGTNKAVYLENKPRAKKIFKANNSDGSGDVSVASADPAAWGTNLSFAAATAVGTKYRKITGLLCYPDESGNEAMWAFKVDIPWIVPSSGNPYPLSLQEMETVRNTKNGAASLVNNVYLFFSLLNGLERYYGGNVDDVGPNLGEGLPGEREGFIATMLSYPGKFFAGVNAGDNYSSLIERDNNGWHERYRAPKGQQIKALGYQVIPGTAPDRMWVFQGNDLIWLPFPSEMNELADPNYKFTHEGALTLSRMHAGMMDVQKLVKTVKLWTDQLAAETCWIEVDYRLNEETEWTTFDDIFSESPQSEIDMTPIYGMAGKRIQLRLRFYTADASVTPILLAVIVEAVTRVSVKYMYPLTFRLMDYEETLAGREPDDIEDGLEKLRIIDEWADDRSDSMLFVESQSRLWHGRMVFINPPDTMQVKVNANPEGTLTRDVYVCSATLQEA